LPRNIVAEELLRAEGFTEIVYVDTPARVGSAKAIADRVDFTLSFARLTTSWQSMRVHR